MVSLAVLLRGIRTRENGKMVSIQIVWALPGPDNIN
jgi:hypothetical protein